MNRVSAPPAPSSLLEGLSKLGSAIVGLSAFAYIAGFIKLIAMYDSVGAGWIIDFIVTQDIIRAGLEPLAMVGVTGAASAYILSSRNWATAKLLTFLFIAITLTYAKFIPSEGWSENWINSYKFSKLISYILYLISGVLVAYSVSEVAIDKRFSGKNAAIFFIGATFSLYITPTYLGKVWANTIISSENKLPKAIGEQYKGESCYLLGNVNSKYAIGCISSSKVGRVQLIEVGKDVAFTRE